jgi:Domain of unknown function DUF29
MAKATLCDQDFLQWTQQQAEYLRQGYWAGLDVEKIRRVCSDFHKILNGWRNTIVVLVGMRLKKCRYQQRFFQQNVLTP